MTSDGTGVNLTIPAAEVQTAGTITDLIEFAVGTVAWIAIRGACIAGLTASGVGVALIPLICTPASSAFLAFIKTLIDAIADGSIGSTQFFVTLLIATAGAAIAGFLWEKWAAPFFNRRVSRRSDTRA